ncbi:SPW repeat domain-containing protein [Natronococcus wangiae]|uniref:SPW repeat domain-containing protein n=1 Tax=Natronococcus wangiae TaxID=3068275 RepID=UPI00273D7020|nr:SPW repeat protein [Natronococcus sp. AD5]
MSNRWSTRDTTVPVPRLAGLAAVLGTWIFWSGVFFTGFGFIILNNVLVGAAIAVLAAYTAARPSGGRLPPLAAPLLIVPLGLWTVVAPFVFGIPMDILFWSNVIMGALVTILAAASVYGSWRLETATATRA